MSQKQADKVARFQQHTQPEFPGAQAEVVDGVIWIAIRRGEGSRILKLPLETLEAPTTEMLERIRDGVQAWSSKKTAR